MDELNKHVADGMHAKKKKGGEEEKKRKGDVPQTQVHQVKWVGWLMHPSYA